MGYLAGPRWQCLAGPAVRHSGVPFLLAIKRCTARLATSKRWAHFLCDQKNREVKVQKMLYGQQETNLRPSNFACSALLAKLPLLLTTSTFAGAGEGLRSSSWLQKRINAVLDNHTFFSLPFLIGRRAEHGCESGLDKFVFLLHKPYDILNPMTFMDCQKWNPHMHREKQFGRLLYQMWFCVSIFKWKNS